MPWKFELAILESKQRIWRPQTLTLSTTVKRSIHMLYEYIYTYIHTYIYIHACIWDRQTETCTDRQTDKGWEKWEMKLSLHNGVESDITLLRLVLSSCMKHEAFNDTLTFYRTQNWSRSKRSDSIISNAYKWPHDKCLIRTLSTHHSCSFVSAGLTDPDRGG